MSDIYALLEGKTMFDPDVLGKFGPEVGKVLVTKLQSKQGERVPTLRMSNVGKPLRQLWYELNGHEAEEISGKTLLKFAYGDVTEALIVALAEASGHVAERFQEEISVDGVVGHIDLVLDGILVDIKSCSAYSFQKFKTGQLLEPGNDPFGYVAQLSGYAHALDLPAAWVAFDKQSGEICILRLPQERIDGYDIRSRISTVRDAIRQVAPPERCYEDEPDGKSGNRKLSVGCSYCGFKTICWSDANEGSGLRTFLYSTGPRYLTEVKREPKVFSVKED